MGSGGDNTMSEVKPRRTSFTKREPQRAQGPYDEQSGLHEGRQARHDGEPPFHAPGNNPDVPVDGSGT